MATATAAKETREDRPAISQKFQLLPVGLVQESKTNPRKTFDEEALEELAASIREQGIVEPLIVRAVEDKDAPYELVAGARRLRAARKAKLQEVPCLVRELTDDAALEIQVIENLQRQDLQPVEEARGYEQLLARGYKIEDLAKKISKSERYVYARLELIKLSKPVLASLEAGKITASHAALIATLPTEEKQKEALDRAFVSTWNNGDNEMIVTPKRGDSDVNGLVSVRDFQKTVIAMKVGAELVGTLESLKSGGFKAALISEEGWGQPRAVLTNGRWKRQGSNPCKFPAKGVVVDEKGRGKVLDVCISHGCKKHFPQPVAWSPRQATRAEKLSQIKQDLQGKMDKAVAGEVFEAFVKSGHGILDRADLERVGLELIRSGDNSDAFEKAFPFAAQYDWKKQEKAIAALKDKELAQFIRAATWKEAVADYGDDDVEDFLVRAQKLGVDVKGITKKHLAVMDEAFLRAKDTLPPEEPKAQTSAKPKKAAAKAKPKKKSGKK